MSWRSYIYPQTIARFQSRYNRDIRVVEEFGRPKLLVNGSPQSGHYIQGLWKGACRRFWRVFPSHVRSILVLGVAGGTVIRLLQRQYPDAIIVGVEIDPTMLSVGKQYFNLHESPSLRLIRSDARKFIRDKTKKEAYDLIVVDLFFGRDIPRFVGKPLFFRSLASILSSDGSVLVNFLREREYRNLSEEVKSVLQHIFPTVTEYPRALNRFFLASKR